MGYSSQINRPQDGLPSVALLSLRHQASCNLFGHSSLVNVGKGSRTTNSAIRPRNRIRVHAGLADQLHVRLQLPGVVRAHPHQAEGLWIKISCPINTSSIHWRSGEVGVVVPAQEREVFARNWNIFWAEELKDPYGGSIWQNLMKGRAGSLKRRGTF